MKKTYKTPKVKTIEIETSSIVAASPEAVSFFDEAADSNAEVMSTGNGGGIWDWMSN